MGVGGGLDHPATWMSFYTKQITPWVVFSALWQFGVFKMSDEIKWIMRCCFVVFWVFFFKTVSSELYLIPAQVAKKKNRVIYIAVLEL